MATYQTEWEHLYLRAQNETDPARLHQCVMDCEAAMFVRGQQLKSAEASDEAVQSELSALRDATNGLLAIKTKQLGWPGLPPADGDGH